MQNAYATDLRAYPPGKVEFSGANLREQVRYDTLQHTATHCNTLQHIATMCVVEFSGANLREQVRYDFSKVTL